MKVHPWLVLAALAAVGCGPSVKGVCDDLSDECEDFVPEDECIDEGELLEDRAERLGCEEFFDGYLDCIEVQLCGWAEGCREVEADLRDCLGS